MQVCGLQLRYHYDIRCRVLYRQYADLTYSLNYVISACRSVAYNYEKDVEFRGIPLLRFKLASNTWANATDWPPNAGYCSGKPEMCGVSGIMRQDPCRAGKPKLNSSIDSAVKAIIFHSKGLGFDPSSSPTSFWKSYCVHKNVPFDPDVLNACLAMLGL